MAARIDATGVSWDGRLRVAAVDLASGRRVMFGAPGSPPATVGQAVEASCAIPGYFRPVAIGGRRYVDGGAWSPTNMDTADVARGAEVLCLNPTGASGPSVAGAVGLVSRSAATVEALALRRAGARVTVVVPDPETAAVMAGNLMNPGPRDRVSAAATAQGRRLAGS
jgi:NTE family protein